MRRDIGEAVNPYGTVEAVSMIDGERYYFLRDGHGTVAMIPADVIEDAGDA